MINNHKNLFIWWKWRESKDFDFYLEQTRVFQAGGLSALNTISME